MELDKFVRVGPTGDEMDSGRSQIKGNLILGQESVSNHMTHLAMDEIYYGDFVSVDHHLDQVARVTRDDVMDLAREFLRPDGFTLVALGPDEAEDSITTAWPPASTPASGS